MFLTVPEPPIRSKNIQIRIREADLSRIIRIRNTAKKESNFSYPRYVVSQLIP